MVTKKLITSKEKLYLAREYGLKIICSEPTGFETEEAKKFAIKWLRKGIRTNRETSSRLGVTLAYQIRNKYNNPIDRDLVKFAGELVQVGREIARQTALLQYVTDTNIIGGKLL